MAQNSRYGTMSSGEPSRRVSMSSMMPALSSHGSMHNNNNNVYQHQPPSLTTSPIDPTAAAGFASASQQQQYYQQQQQQQAAAGTAGVEIDPFRNAHFPQQINEVMGGGVGGVGGTLSSSSLLSASNQKGLGAGAGRSQHMTLRQSMSVLATEQPGRVGGAATIFNNNNTSTNNDDAIPSDEFGTPKGARDGSVARYTFMSPASDNSSTTTTSTSPQQLVDDAASQQPLQYDVEPFMLPTMPTNVTRLVFSLLSNWGDSYYVGLAGIEVFDGRGKRVVPSSASSPAACASIHSTFDVIAQLGSKFGGDIRASCIAGASNLSNVGQLISGSASKRSTTDANEMFRMPVNLSSAIGLGDNGGGANASTNNSNTLIWIEFTAPIDISLIRIYNYNVGREQCSKGVQLMEILSVPPSTSNPDQQQQLLFRGEIAMASGDCDNEPEQILFVPSPTISTSSVQILNTIVEEDAKFAESLRAKDPFLNPFPSSDSLSVSGGNSPVDVRCPSPPPLHPHPIAAISLSQQQNNTAATASSLAPPVVTSFQQKQALQHQHQRGESANSSRGNSGGGTATTTVAQTIQPIFGAATGGSGGPSSIGGVGGGSGGGLQHRLGRITSASAASAALRSALANTNNNNGSNNNNSGALTSRVSGGGGGGKCVSFASAGLLADGSSSGCRGSGGAHQPAHDPSSCPRSVVGVCIGFQSTWGDPHFVGLSGIRFFSSAGELVFNVAQMAIARPPVALTGLTQNEAAALASFDGEVSCLTDGDVTTACVWRFQEQMQLRIRFDPPVPSLGFIEIANYGISGSTQCGVKAAQVFVAAAAAAGTTGPTNPNALFDQLWQSSTLPPNLLMLTLPDAPLIIRKSPNHLSILKHQSFDLSSSGVSGDSGIRGAVTMTTSMTASMAARAKIEMKRARMSLFDGPPPANATPHGIAVATTVLPQGYVVKMELGLAIVSPTAADLKPLLKSIINEGMGKGSGGGGSSGGGGGGGGGGSGSSAPSSSGSGSGGGGGGASSGAITLYDEDCAVIPRGLFNIAVTLKHEEMSVVSSSNSNNLSGVFLPNGGSLGGGDVTASIVIDRGFRDMIIASQHEELPPTPTSPQKQRHLVTLSFTFVFDIPAAISAISHHFKTLQSAQGRIARPSSARVGPASASVTHVKVLVDDEPTFESLEFDLEAVIRHNNAIANGTLGGGGGDDDGANDEEDAFAAMVEPPPRCVAFVWDPKLLSKF